MENLGDIIRKKRTEKGLTLKNVAEDLGIDQAVLSKAERGNRRLTREQVVNIAHYLELDEEALLVEWLSEKLFYEVGDEKIAIQALQAAEEKIAYEAYKKIDKKAFEKAIKRYLRTNNYIKRGWLFGSFARGEDDYKSDIDVMIEVLEGSHFSLFDLAEVQEQLESLTSRKVDVVMKDGVGPFVMESIKQDMRVIYERQKDYREKAS